MLSRGSKHRLRNLWGVKHCESLTGVAPDLLTTPHGRRETATGSTFARNWGLGPSFETLPDVPIL